MRLVELDAEFVKVVTVGKLRRRVKSLADAQGLIALCPNCLAAHPDGVGVHSMLLWFRGRGVLDLEQPGPARWDVSGTGLKDLTLSPSVQLVGGCNWHGWIRSGAAVTD